MKSLRRYFLNPVMDILRIPFTLLFGIGIFGYFLLYGLFIIGFLFSVVCALFGVTHAWYGAFIFMFFGVVLKAGGLIAKDSAGWLSRQAKQRRRAEEDEPFMSIAPK